MNATGWEGRIIAEFLVAEAKQEAAFLARRRMAQQLLLDILELARPDVKMERSEEEMTRCPTIAS